MKIKVSEKEKSTGSSSTTQALNLLSAFPCSDILNQIYCDHIYSSVVNVNQTRHLESETSEDEDDSSENSEDIVIQIPRNPCVITKLIKVPESAEAQRPAGEEIDGKGVTDENKGKKKIVHFENEDAKLPIKDRARLEPTRELENYEVRNTGENSRGTAVYSETEAAKRVTEDGRSEANTRLKNFDNISDNDMKWLNAESIQKVFQSMICMTSLTPITDISNQQKSKAGILHRTILDVRKEEVGVSGKAKGNVTNDNGSNNKIPPKPFTIYDRGVDRNGQMCVKLRMESDIGPNTSTSNTHSKQEHVHVISTCDTANSTLSAATTDKCSIAIKQDKRKRSQILRKSSYTSGNNLSVSEKTAVEDESKLHNEDVKTSKPNYQTVNDKEFKEISREIESDIELYIKIKYTLELLIKKWGEYLAMTDDQIRDMEVQNARDYNMVEEVIEMLEDKDRYVWELIEDLIFF